MKTSVHTLRAILNQTIDYVEAERLGQHVSGDMTNREKILENVELIVALLKEDGV